MNNINLNVGGANVVLTENELFKNRDKKTNYKNKFKYGSKIKDIDNLKVGDYVVHLNHGIGMYTGIKTLTKNGNKKDYIEVSYKHNDKLYIPVEKIDLITKYSSNEGVVPRLNKLGGSEWQKTKLRVKNKVKDIADKLIKISATSFFFWAGENTSILSWIYLPIFKRENAR